ncbi:MAG: J domain-containing protein [Puia sp.]|nr:J domain-containing protein [Puia sp.]
MDFIDYYKTLGIDKGATQDQIRSAYRKLARKYHPDLNPNDKDANKKFQQINEANEVLSDPEKRKKYDQYGKDWQHAEAFEKAGAGGGARGSGGKRRSQGGASPFGSEEYTYSGEGMGDFSDFFESLFGGSGRSASGGNARFRGSDYQAELQLSLEDAYHTHPQTFLVNGKNIRITVPAGVANGQVIKLKGHGSPGTNGGPAGDLYITFSITPDPRYKRDGDDLHVTEKIDLYTAVLGGEITVATLTGKVKVKVAPGTQNGTRIRLKEKGFPLYKNEGKFGALYLSFEVEIPTQLTDKQRELFTELAKLVKG